MKIKTEIDLCDNRYNVQVDTFDFTHNENQFMAQFGEPTIDIGGTITGSLGRPGQTNTTVSITGGGGTGATAAPIILNGVITGYTVNSPGSGYGSAPTVTITGDGSGAAAAAVLSGTALASITVISGGTGYHVSPININLVFPAAIRRIRSDMPVKRVFDLGDDVNSDVEAQFYATTIAGRLTAAKNALLTQPTFFEGETVSTV